MNQQDLFKYLPAEITIDILSRLPARAVVCCKCVCKPWLQLVVTREFVYAHLSKSVPTLLVTQSLPASLVNEVLEHSKSYQVLEFEDGFDESHELQYTPLTQFSLPGHGIVYGSVNGLLLLRDKSLKPDGLFICNPITRDYVKLDCPQEFECSDKYVVAYGFGVSKISGKYKVVRISQECHREGTEQLTFSVPELQVYTLGTSWRKITPSGPQYLYGGPSYLAPRYFGTFLDGNLLWLAISLDGKPWISCFDLETETFCGIPSPLPRQSRCLASLCAMRGVLCLCDNSSDAEIAIWFMNEDGEERFWWKAHVISKPPEFFPFRFMMTFMVTGLIFPLTVFKDGDTLFEWNGSFLFRYCEKDKDNPFGMFYWGSEAIIHTPSFLSLKSFNIENVSTL